jgi:hypothetical protein
MRNPADSFMSRVAPRGDMRRNDQYSWMGELHEFPHRHTEGFGWVEDVNLLSFQAALKAAYYLSADGSPGVEKDLEDAPSG